MTGDPSTTWGDQVAPLVKKFRLAATFRCQTTLEAEGAAALAKLLEKMAEQLDEVHRIIAREMSHV